MVSQVLKESTSKNSRTNLDKYQNPIEEFIDNTSKETTENFSGDKKFEGKIKNTLKSIINENEIKTIDEETIDITKVVSDEVEAKKIHLTTSDFVENNPESVEKYRKEEFKRNFEEEIKKANPKITEDQLSKSREYADLVAENLIEHNELSSQKNVALSQNSQLFGPGAMQNGWTDLQGMFNFLKKGPKEIDDIKNKYNSLKDGLKDIKLPTNLRQVSSLDNVMSALNNPDSNNLFSKTKKYLGWADKVDKWTGGWLSKTVNKAGQKVINKIGNQAVSEFASNALGVFAKEGFQKGFTTVLNGILGGGVETITTNVTITGGTGTHLGRIAGGTGGIWLAGRAIQGMYNTKIGAKLLGTKFGQKISAEVWKKVAVKAGVKVTAQAGAQAGLLGAAAGASTVPVAGWIVALALVVIDAVLWIKKKFDKLIEKIGMSTKKFFAENFGKVGGWLIRTSLKIIALPLMLVGAVSAVALLPIMIGVFGFMFIFQIFQGGLISGLVPPKGQIIKNVVVSVVKNKINSATGKIFGEGCPSGWPTTGAVSQGPNGTYSHQGKEAVDIARTNGYNAPIKATHQGRVVLVTKSLTSGCGYGVTVSGTCEGKIFTSKYCHMQPSSLLVGMGDKVEAGDTIGTMGTTGNSTGNHLHYVFTNLAPINDYLPEPPTIPRGVRISPEIPVKSSYE